MVTTKEMKKCRGKNIKIKFTDGEIWEKRYCDSYQWDEDESEELMLELGNFLIKQSEIESIEILD
ncbi:hypothetical protein [Peptoanaerobacter stomatis]|uniref:hypothetical protein n=1 Tax=Peptoanaerobacter stomatis TaxID=796937 RepID=UPI003F9F15CA